MFFKFLFKPSDPFIDQYPISHYYTIFQNILYMFYYSITGIDWLKKNSLVFSQKSGFSPKPILFPKI